MLVRKATEADIRAAASAFGFDLLEFRPSGKGFRFRIVPGESGDVYRKRSSSYFNRGRRVHAICWHGHREFFRKLFTYAPEAIVITSLARYTADNFEDTHVDTGYKNVGAPISPVQYRESCECSESGLA